MKTLAEMDGLVRAENDMTAMMRELMKQGNSACEEMPFSQLSEIFMWAVAIGVRRGKRRSLNGKTDGPFRYSYLNRDSDIPVLEAIAVLEEKSTDVLCDGTRVITIAEEYANEGLYEIKRMIAEGSGISLSPLLALLDETRVLARTSLSEGGD